MTLKELIEQFAAVNGLSYIVEEVDQRTVRALVGRAGFAYPLCVKGVIPDGDSVDIFKSWLAGYLRAEKEAVLS